jgi:hypothetical protein
MPGRHAVRFSPLFWYRIEAQVEGNGMKEDGRDGIGLRDRRLVGNRTLLRDDQKSKRQRALLAGCWRGLGFF